MSGIGLAARGQGVGARTRDRSERQHRLPAAADPDGARLCRAGAEQSWLCHRDPGSSRWAAHICRAAILRAIARPHLETLRDAVGETAYLVVFIRGEIVQLCKADGKQAVSASVRSMVREPATVPRPARSCSQGWPRMRSTTTWRVSNCRRSPRRRSRARRSCARRSRRFVASGLCPRLGGVCAEPVLRERPGPQPPRQQHGRGDQHRHAQDAVQALACSTWGEQLREKSGLISQQLGLIEI